MNLVCAGRRSPPGPRGLHLNDGAPIAGALLHPVAVGGLLVLVLNDHIFKAAYPSWITGKLSDIAGLALFPFFLQASYELWSKVTCRRGVSRRTSFLVASIVTGVVFAVVEITPWGDALYRVGLGLLQWVPAGLSAVAVGQPLPTPQPVAATPDPMDLMALVVLPALNLAVLQRFRLRSRLPSSRGVQVEHLAGVAVLVVASVAIVATSQPPPPESVVEDEYVEEIELTAAQPVVIRQLAVTLNREALTADVRPSATATLKLMAAPDAARGDEGQEDAMTPADLVTIQVTPDAADEPPIVSVGPSTEGLRFFSHDPTWGVDTCRAAGPCERTYRVLLELSDPSASPLRFQLVADGQVRYLLEEPPAGAAIAIDAVGELDARGPVPTVDARVEGVVELTRFEGAEVHVRITRSAAAAAAEPQAEAVLVIESLDERPEEAYPRVNVFLGHENRVGSQGSASERYQYGAEDLPRSARVVPFGSCQPSTACTVEYNIRFGLCCSRGEDYAASVAWSFAVTLRHLDAAELPTGTSLDVELVPEAQFQDELVQRCIAVGREIIAKAEQSWNLPSAEADEQRARLERGEWLPEMVHPDWRTICDLALAGRLDASHPLPSQP